MRLGDSARSGVNLAVLLNVNGDLLAERLHPWAVPQGLILDQGSIRYAPRSVARQVDLLAGRESMRRLLVDFVALERASGEQILNFAQEWGPLYICAHGRALGHPACARTCQPKIGTEPLEAWRWWAKVFRLALLTQRDRGCARELRAITGEAQRHSPEDLLIRVATGIAWHWGHLRPHLVQRGRGFDSSFNVGLGGECWEDGLRAALSMTLLSNLGGALTRCQNPECGRWFSPKGRPRRYCPDCGLKAAWRAASRRYYQRKKEKEQR